MAFTPPTTPKTDATFEELLRFALQKDAGSNFIGMTVLGANGTSLYPLPLAPGGTAVNTQITGSTAQYSTPAHRDIAVGTTSTQVLAANASRKYVLIVNNSDTTIYLGFGTAAATGTGIPLSPGGNYEMNSTNLYTGVINAIHGSTGSKDVRVLEGV